MAVVRLQKNREKSLLNRHPWVFSGAVGGVEGEPKSGDVVDVLKYDGGWLGRGYYNEHSNIRVRVLEWDAEVEVNEAWWRARIAAAVDRRASMARDAQGNARTNALRLVHAEADLLPGLIVDRYGDYLAVQFLTAGVERVRELIVDILSELVRPAAVYDRSDADTRKKEKLPPSTGIIAGTLPGGPIEIVENGHRFLVDFATAQKTGFYLDQRENRCAAAAYASGRAVLDAFAYTGAFSVYAGRSGAKSLTLVESSQTAVELARRNLALNEIPETAAEVVHGNVFDVLRAWRDQQRRFDLVILDPPKFARTRAQTEQALRGYKDVNLLAMRLLSPGGVLVTFSCSGGVDAREFTTAVAWAGLDAGRPVQVLRRLGQPEDHPVITTVPESEYLKGLVCRLL